MNIKNIFIISFFSITSVFLGVFLAKMDAKTLDLNPIKKEVGDSEWMPWSPKESLIIKMKDGKIDIEKMAVVFYSAGLSTEEAFNVLERVQLLLPGYVKNKNVYEQLNERQSSVERDFLLKNPKIFYKLIKFNYVCLIDELCYKNSKENFWKKIKDETKKNFVSKGVDEKDFKWLLPSSIKDIELRYGVNRNFMMREDKVERWIDLVSYWLQTSIKIKPSSDAKSFKMSDFFASLDRSGLRSIQFNIPYTEKKEYFINGIKEGVEKANFEIKKISKWEGGVLGLNGRVNLILLRPLVSRNRGFAFISKNDELVIVSTWEALGHEWMHGVDFWLARLSYQNSNNLFLSKVSQQTLLTEHVSSQDFKGKEAEITSRLIDEISKGTPFWKMKKRELDIAYFRNEYMMSPSESVAFAFTHLLIEKDFDQLTGNMTSEIWGGKLKKEEVKVIDKSFENFFFELEPEWEKDLLK